MTPRGLIRLALRAAGVNGQGQSPSDEDTNDTFDVLNFMLAEWQINRWLVYNLSDAALIGTGAASYSVGPASDFVFPTQRPDKIDAVYVNSHVLSEDVYLYPFMSREGYDRVKTKAATGTPESFFYDPGMGTVGTLYIYPLVSTGWTIHVQAKGQLSQFSSLDGEIALPPPHISAIFWNLAVAIRPLYQLDPDPQIVTRASEALKVLMGSIAQVPQATQPVPSNRSGIYSGVGISQ